MSFIFASLLTAVTFAQAENQDTDQQPIVVIPKVQELDYTGIELTATVSGPQISIVNERIRMPVGTLSKLRLDFNMEISQTANDVK